VPKNVLIANRGEIACRIQSTCKRLGIATVAVYSDADADAPHVKAAERSVRLGPPPVKESYLDVAAILEAARATGADAIHPGYGLLSENAAFAAAVRSAGLIFIGPPAAALEAFGDKIKARGVARSVGALPPPGTDGPVAPDDGALTAEAERIGYPILVKAAGGGGGIGMQVVDAPAKLLRAVQACSDRGRSAFSDERVYMERYVASPKHIEVQIVADDHGHTIALGERECSLQRRHQKIVEEAPSPAAFFEGTEGEIRRRAVWDAAVRVVSAVGYRGAGTVEFVASPTGELFFLEVNARLQVEHCVTEMVTRLDLVEQQLRVADGQPLTGDAITPERRGHAIEARLYAEDPKKRFAPQPGLLEVLRWPAAGPDLRIETGVTEGMSVTPFYDPMIAKVVAHGATRAEAIARLDRALEGTSITLVGPAGPSQTNLAFLRAILATETFAVGQYDTSYAEVFAKTFV